MALESFKSRGMVLKVETTEGTDATPAAATDAIQMFDGSSGITADRVEREVDRPHFGHHPFANTNLRGFIEGGIEIVPPSGIYDASTKASVDAALQIAGMAKTFTAEDLGPPVVPANIVYNPISRLIPSATGYFWHAGTLYKLLGSRANITGLQMDIGSYLRAQLRVEGSCTEVTEASLPTDFDFSAFTTPPVISTETMVLAINGFNVEGKSLGLDFGSTLNTIEHSEARISRISDRQPTFTARFYRPARASLDPWALWKAGTILPLVGSVTDETTLLQSELTIRGQVEEVRPTDIDGDLGYEITGRCIPTDAGGDEFSLKFSDTTP